MTAASDGKHSPAAAAPVTPKLGLEAIPLIQIQGHVEWLLKHEKYAHLREMNSFQFCPSHPETLPLLKRWLDEVLTIFPNAKHIHLGGDEVESLGICPVCKARGKAEVYLAHARAMTEYAVSKGIVPILWGDMFIQENLSAESLPEETVLVDWKYWGRAPYRSTLTLEKSGRTVWGASAILQSWYDFHGGTSGQYPLMAQYRTQCDSHHMGTSQQYVESFAAMERSHSSFPCRRRNFKQGI